MNFDLLNQMIEYIESNLDNEIDFDKLSKITNTNIFILERIFMFLTNMTINEYIKKRRLSKAFEEIRNTDAKIIDIAFKYQYNSATSFNRAFKQLFNITPTECRRGVGNYKIMPKEHFIVNKGKYNFDYEIKKIDSITLYCYHVSAETLNDLLYEIRHLYKRVQSMEIYDEFNEVGMYGVYAKEGDLHNYYLGSTKYYPELEEYKIKENEYAEFKLSSRYQRDIVDLENRIDRQWIPSTNYNIKSKYKVELYKGDSCYIYLPLN